MKSPSKNIYYVYLHRCPQSSEVFYVGMGKAGRAWECGSRSAIHKDKLLELVKSGYTPADFVELEVTGLSKQEATALEAALIKSHTGKQLLNSVNLDKSKDLDKACALYAEGVPVHQIREECKVSWEAFRLELRQRHIPFRGKGRRPGPRHKFCPNKIREEFRKCPNVSQVCKVMGCKSGTVYRALSAKNMEIPPNRRKYDHDLCWSLYCKGVSISKLAEMFGCSYQGIKKTIDKYKSKRVEDV